MFTGTPDEWMESTARKQNQALGLLEKTPFVNSPYLWAKRQRMEQVEGIGKKRFDFGLFSGKRSAYEWPPVLSHPVDSPTCEPIYARVFIQGACAALSSILLRA